MLTCWIYNYFNLAKKLTQWVSFLPSRKVTMKQQVSSDFIAVTSRIQDSKKKGETFIIFIN